MVSNPVSLPTSLELMGMASIFKYYFKFLNTNPLTALGGGLAGACAVTLIHETVRRIVPEAPRLDLLGMTAIEKGLRAAGKKAPGETQLFTWALAGDIVTNSLYFSLAGVGKEK